MAAYRIHWSMVFINRNFQLSPLAAERYYRVPIHFCWTCFCRGGRIDRWWVTQILSLANRWACRSAVLRCFFAVPEADAVHDQVAVQNVSVDVGGHQHLEVRKLPLGQLQANSMCLLGRQAIRCRKELDEVVVLPAICFNEPLLGELYLLPRRRGSTVLA